MNYKVYVIAIMVFVPMLLRAEYSAVECGPGKTPVRTAEGWACEEGSPSVVYPTGESIRPLFE